ncbi:MAG: hypothetical protein ACTH1D_06765 [Mycobacteriaceae bacterium]|uniref:Replication protein n=1 Tax=Corynebacterium variabile (strain DSM 44702 / CIP 107183 / JCM 12073 / NCIMB 30131) TaxID=858619 RepID=G0HF23_CORVD|nr:hypothetical protein [Corynebacterium variabile]AEK37475.1 hypothetical protein CVAR_2125 [Corynebacterium variabile DSM 44702]
MPKPTDPNKRYRNLSVAQYLRNPRTGAALIDLDAMVNGLNAHKQVRQWCYIIHQEDPDNPLTKHVHVLVRCKDATKVRQIDEWLAVGDWERVWSVDGGDRGCGRLLHYFLHHGAAGAGKRVYDPADMVASDGFDWMALMDGVTPDTGDRNPGKASPRGRIIDGNLTASEARRVTSLSDSVIQQARAEHLASATPPRTRVGMYLQTDMVAAHPLSTALADQFGDHFDAPVWHGWVTKHQDGYPDEIVGRDPWPMKQWATYDGQPVIICRGIVSKATKQADPDRCRDCPTVEDYAMGTGGATEFFRMLEATPHGSTGRLIETSAGPTQPMNAVTILVGSEPWEKILPDLEALYREVVSNPGDEARVHFPIIIPVSGQMLGVAVLSQYVDPSAGRDQYTPIARVREVWRESMDRVDTLPVQVQGQARKQVASQQLAPVIEAETTVRKQLTASLTDDAYTGKSDDDILAEFMDQARAGGLGQAC